MASRDQPHCRGGGPQPGQDCQDGLVNAGNQKLYSTLLIHLQRENVTIFYQNGIVVDRAEEQIHTDTFWQTGPGDKYTR